MHSPFHRFARHAGDFHGPHGGRHDASSHGCDPRERFAALRERAFQAMRGHHGHDFDFDHEASGFDCQDPRGGGRGGRGGRGFFGGGFEGPRGGRGGDAFDGMRGGRGRGGARPLGHGDLPLLMLSLIAEQPRHGYELIRLIEELFHGAYSPSPGAIYPTLAQLEDMGLIAPTADEGRKRYAITDEGREHMERQREAIEAVRTRTHRSAREFAKAQIPAPVREALGRIKRGVMARHGRWTEDEIERIAAALAQAADEMEQSK